jgi:hypothetical protein
VLDRGYDIPFAAGSVVEHPVPPAEPMRFLANAKRANLMPYLFTKHPSRFRAARMRTIARSQYPYLLLYAAGLACLASGLFHAAAATLVLIFVLTVLHALKLFWGYRFTRNELWLTLLLLPVVPLVTVVQLVRGNLAERVLLFC